MFLTNQSINAVTLATALATVGWVTLPTMAGTQGDLPEVVSHTNQDEVPGTRQLPLPDDGALTPGGSPRWLGETPGGWALDPNGLSSLGEGGMPATIGEMLADRATITYRELTDTTFYEATFGDAPVIGDLIAPDFTAAIPPLLAGTGETLGVARQSGFGAPIPAPGALALLGLGGTALMGARRRRS